MSYYGYPNPAAYNYQQAYAAYAAAAAAGNTNSSAAAAGYNQYHAYNAAAYQAMQHAQQQAVAQQQQQQQQQPQQNKMGSTISQGPQRYNPIASSGRPATASNTQQQNQASRGAVPYANVNTGGQHMSGGGTHQTGFKNRAGFGYVGGGGQRKMGGGGGGNSGGAGAQQPMFYCEVCKISCAGPQTYKEHLEGQKHKKKEQAIKVESESAPAIKPNTSETTMTTTSAEPDKSESDSNGVEYQAQQQQNLSRLPRFGANNSMNQMNIRAQHVIKCELCNVACTGRDAYAAHLRGSKHQKTLKLHKKLGKPIPPDHLIQASPPPSSMSSTTTPATNTANIASTQTGLNAQNASFPQAEVISGLPANLGKTPQQINSAIKNLTSNAPGLVASAAPVLTNNAKEGTQAPPPPAASISEQSNDQADMGDDGDVSNNEPIGKEYIETRFEGKIQSFYCKLCDCKFNDPNAKDMHTKGRRHRLAYKKKVDPSLVVELKGGGPMRMKTTIMAGRQANMMRMGARAVGSEVLSKMPKSLMTSGSDLSASSMVGGDDLGTNGATNGSCAQNPIKPLMSANDCGVGHQAAPQSLRQFMSQQPFKDSNRQFGFNNQFGYNQMGGYQQNRIESFDDRHLMAKHNSIYPTKEEISAIQEVVSNSEKALKLVSDQIAEEEEAAANEVEQKRENGEKKPEVDTEVSIKVEKIENESKTDEKQESPKTPNGNTDTTNTKTDEKKTTQQEKQRILKGVMRVGLLSKGLLLKGDTDVKLVVLCAKYPTKSLLERVHKILIQKIEAVAPDVKYSTILDLEAETILIVRLSINDVLQPMITCRIVLTSPSVRAEEDQIATNGANEQSTADNHVDEEQQNFLDKQKCLDSLAELRHANWFQARAAQVPNCVILIRVLRDLCRRNSTWTNLSQWALELLVERSLGSSSQQMSPGESLRRFLECVSSGVLLPNGPGLFDPCEKKPTDAAENLKKQQREELTASAQMALRLLAFKQIYKILGMECLNQQNFPYNSNSKTAQKRHHETTENEPEDAEEEIKREKTEDLKENPVETKIDEASG